MFSIRKVLLVALIAVLVGCNTTKPQVLDDGYQVGDGLRSVLELQKRYCERQNPVDRALLLAVVRKIKPEYPVSGLCTDLTPILLGE